MSKKSTNITYKVSNKQLELLHHILNKLELDENDKSLVQYVLSEKKYTEFHKKILLNLRARYIREMGFHNINIKYENELTGINIYK